MSADLAYSFVEKRPGVVELSRYALETLRIDEEFSLYRGRGEGEPPQVLVLAPVSDRPEPGVVKRLEHEYTVLQALDLECVPKPLALARHHGRMMLVLDDPGGQVLDRFLRPIRKVSAARIASSFATASEDESAEADADGYGEAGAQPIELGRFLRLAINLAGGLAQLHRQGLIHKDIKPANILVDSTTDKVWFTGFGIASRLPRERQLVESPETIAGTLAYMAPEQTGRMNRSIDSRTDLYSLGVTFYQMLTGCLPFTASDPMEWVHCHIARKPPPPSEQVRNVPATVSAIIMRLLAKMAEERYQTASGLEADLSQCLAQWEAQGRIDDFSLGKKDKPDRLLIPEKLYGRVREIETLLASLERVATSGAPELVLVYGHSGIGKSSVVNELRRVLGPNQGLFASGKSDQYKQDIPYATLAQAFQSLIRPLLTKSDNELGSWRNALREVLGPNGRIMVDLIPELRLIVGEQPRAPDLSSKDTQSRFRLLIRRFIGVFAQPDHPLALFLDDLQWVDPATLDLFEDLLLGPDMQHLMLIGAYRDNEVDSNHPLMRKLEALRRSGVIVREIMLAPLTREDLARLIADSVHSDPELAGPLAQVVHEKTGGNPFFAIQFISALADEGLLTFEQNVSQRSWDLNCIDAEGYTENVVELMIAKLNRLPRETLTALQQMACLGNRAEIAALSIILGIPEEQIHSNLWEALDYELIQRSEGAYQFVHDRVQEAAYSLIPEEVRPEVHLRIGKLLAAHTAFEKRDEAIFNIVNQINRGPTLVSSPSERRQAAELNLIAGKRAKASTAYAAALRYLITGAALLTEDSGEQHYELAFALEFHRAECEFLMGDLATAERRLSQLWDRARSLADRTAVTCLRINLFVTLDQCDRSVKVGLEYLHSLGIDWAPHPTRDQMRKEFQRIWQQLGSRSINELIELPLLTDPGLHAKMDVLTALLPPALFTDENLFCLIVAHMANVSLEHGNSDGSCLAYVWLGLLLGPHFDEYPAAFAFGQLGIDLVEKRGLDRFRARVYLDFSHVVNPWMKRAQFGPALARRAFDAANEIGDLTFAAYSGCNLVSALLATGDPLAEVQQEAETRLEFARMARFSLISDIITGQLRLILALRGLTPSFSSFDGQGFSEEQFEHHLDGDSGSAVALGWYWVRKLQGRFFAGDQRGAIEAAEKTAQFLWTIPSHIEVAEYHFYAALSRAAYYDTISADSQSPLLDAVRTHHRQLEVWAKNCPENFENRAALVGAEIARLEGRELDAERLYEQAIRSAQANSFVHNEALAYELTARFYLARGFDDIAHLYLRKARYCYLRWGADGKVRQLDEMHPHLRTEEPAPGPKSTIGAPLEHLDLATVIKVSQAVSGEIVLEKLIETLLKIAVEHAGAERGLLILPEGEQYRIEAEIMAGPEQVEVRLRQAPVTSSELPESLLRYVIRTQEKVILADASAQAQPPGPARIHPGGSVAGGPVRDSLSDGGSPAGPDEGGAQPRRSFSEVGNLFSEDPYVQLTHPRSVLCLPLVKQARLMGVLYLENNLASGVFTPQRFAMLELLVSQAAISLDHARVYAELARENSERKRVEEELRRSEAFLAQGQRISQTGSWRWKVATGELYWSEEHFRIFGLDPEIGKPSYSLLWREFIRRIGLRSKSSSTGRCKPRAILNLSIESLSRMDRSSS